MSEEYGSNFITLTDDEGNELEFQHIDTVEEDGKVYMAFIPADLAVEEEAEVVILKVEADENGDEMLITVDDDDEADRIFDIVMQHINEDESEDEE